MSELRSTPVRIILDGEFDLAQRARLDSLLARANDAENVVIDLRHTTYMDSTALGCFIRLKRAMAARGAHRIQLIGLRPNVRKLFELTELDRVFEIVDDGPAPD